MTTEAKIKAAFAAKNWEVEDVDYDRNDGYAVNINTEEYPEIEALGLPAPEPLNEAQDKLIAAYARAFNQVEQAMQGEGCTCDAGGILADTLSLVMRVAKLIPDRLTLSA